jgi:hypothetical protein
MSIFSNNSLLKAELKTNYENISERLSILEESIKKLYTSLDSINCSINELTEKFEQMQKKEDTVPDRVEIVRPVETVSKNVFLAAPTSDAIFIDYSDELQIGKSLYVLNTKDGHNGYFKIIESKDAFATVLISFTSFVKPVCKVIGSLNDKIESIKTIQQGTAVKEDGVWKVTKKAEIEIK